MAINTTYPEGEGQSRMDVFYFGNEMPSGDLLSIFRQLTNLSKGRNHAVLAQFLEDATTLVKKEIEQLSSEVQRQFPPFTTLLAWIEDESFREGLYTGAIEGVLLIVTQVAHLIAYVESSGSKFEDLAHEAILGLGVGLLTACAAASASTLADLPVTGSEAVRVAFRMGIHVQNSSQNIEARDLQERPRTWAYVVNDVKPAAAQEQLDAYNTRTAVPDTGKIFISATGESSVTISGPPSRLESLFKTSEFFRNARYIALPVFGGLCHAPHIYSRSDVETIVKGRAADLFAAKPWQLKPVYSTSTGLPYPVNSAFELYEAVVSELLTHPICFDSVVRGVVDQAKKTEATASKVFTLGRSIPLNDLKTNLAKVSANYAVAVTDIAAGAEDRSQPRGSLQSKLAIVGMSCRLPGGATSTEGFWQILEQGLDVSRQIPADRFDVATHYDPEGKQLNKSMTQYGCFIDEPGLFDAPFFNISPREAKTLDPQMRLALVTAYEALERSGYVPNRTPSTRSERIGTYYGQAADDYREVNQGQEVSTYYIPGGCRAFGPGRINYFFKFSGPSYSIDTACSSGLAAIEVACQALWKGDVDMAVTGGLNILTNPDGFTGLCSGHFLTKGHNACKTWDATADGYCRADAIGSVVIKRLEDAEADNDNILGVILGAGTNHSAEAVSITHPHAGHQAYLARQVLRQAGVDPLDVSYVELHGTGTQAGDYEEMSGIMNVYAPLTKRRSKNQPLYIGASKANVGHSESAAGSTALLKVLLMLQKKAIPPHIGIKTSMNPKFGHDFEKRNLHIPFSMVPWERDSTPKKNRVAVVNNFGAAGGNTTMILEEAPERPVVEVDPRETHVITVTAKSKPALIGNLEHLLAHVDANPEISVADLAYTTTARRHHHQLRLAVVTSDIPKLRKDLLNHLRDIDSIKASNKMNPTPIAFSFTGQGASFKSMSLELYRDAPSFRENIHRLDALARGQGFESIISALDGSHEKEYRHSPVVTQLSQVCSQIALANYWAALGVKPDIVIGHSLGEYAAMHVAGVISASDAIHMVGKRAWLLQEKCKIGSHIMMAVRASLAQVTETSGDLPYTIACINGPSDTVLSGTKKQMDDLEVVLAAGGFRCFKLDVDFAFHSEQIDPILDEFETLANGVVFKDPKLPVISPLLGKVVFDGKTLNARYARRATRETVNFLAALEDAQKVSAIGNDTIWIEIGPHPVCTGFVKSTLPSVNLALPSFKRGESNWKTIAEAMAALYRIGFDLQWTELHRPFEKTSVRLLDLPTYAFDEKNHWIQYNGTWCLTKGNDYYASNEKSVSPSLAPEAVTSLVQRIVQNDFDSASGSAAVTMQSDVMQTDFKAAAYGHRMNSCGVATSSIHADIAYTLGAHLWKNLRGDLKDINIDVSNLVVAKGLIASTDEKTPQLIQVAAETSDILSGVDLTWSNVDNDGKVTEQFATAKLYFGQNSQLLAQWAPLAHLIKSRIEALDRMANEGKANRLSRNMAYTLFANNLVTYAEKYRGMQTVVMSELEGWCDVQLTTQSGGVWTVPPYFIDSVAHLAGFIMNCSDAVDTANNFCVTPGWGSMRFAKPLVPGAKYRSYVKMIPTAEDPSTFYGDVYIMQDGEIMGLVEAIKFHKYPRILLSRFFGANAVNAANHSAPKAAPAAIKAAPAPAPATTKSKKFEPAPAAAPAPKAAAPAPAAAAPAKAAPAPAAAAPAAAAESESSTVAQALKLIADEAGLELSDLQNDVGFSDLGIDSLMSLVIAEKLTRDLGIRVGGSLFLDYPTIGDLRTWLEAS